MVGTLRSLPHCYLEKDSAGKSYPPSGVLLSNNSNRLWGYYGASANATMSPPQLWLQSAICTCT